MGGKKSPSGVAGGAANPTQRIEHGAFVVTGASEDFDSMLIRGIFFAPSIAACHQLAGDRRDRAGAREKLLEPGGQHIEAGAKDLRLGDMTEILMGNFMGQYAAQLIVTGAAHQPHGDVELAVTGISRVDFALIDDSDARLVSTARMIHRS